MIKHLVRRANGEKYAHVNRNDVEREMVATRRAINRSSKQAFQPSGTTDPLAYQPLLLEMHAETHRACLNLEQMRDLAQLHGHVDLMVDLASAVTAVERLRAHMENAAVSTTRGSAGHRG